MPTPTPLHPIGDTQPVSNIKNVTVLGAGVLGSQIAFQVAYKGFAVTAYDIDDDSLALARERLNGYATVYPSQVADADSARAAAVPDMVTYISDLASAVASADLVIEAVPEYLDLKRSVLEQIAELAPAQAIFASNSSTLTPSQLKDSTGRPDRFLHLHFANNIWLLNSAEIVGSDDTAPAVYDSIVDFAEQIGMVPIKMRKEHPGYIGNSLLVPFIQAATSLFINGIADHETIDQTWRIGTGSPLGPFQWIDQVGFNTAYAISMASESEDQRRFAAHLKEVYMDHGKLGCATGEGFYSYR